MVFLLATFMAALFDMQSAVEVMKSDFWKIAVPLMTLVFWWWDLTNLATGKKLRHRLLVPAGQMVSFTSIHFGCCSTSRNGSDIRR
jgi:hypothetical protein